MSTEERSTISSPETYWPWQDFPGWGGSSRFPLTERGYGAIPAESSAILAAGPELLKRLYCRPDYQMVIRQFGEVLLRELEQDNEALEAFKELLERHGASFEDSGNAERIAPLAAGLIVGGAFVGGVVLGYFAEKGKAQK